MADFYINFDESDTNPQPASPWDDNPLHSASVAGEAISSIVGLTGWSFHVITAASNDVYSTSYADADSDWPTIVLRGNWRTGLDSLAEYELRGPAGDVGGTYSINLSGNGDSLTRSTDFTVDGVTKPYVMGTRAAPTNSTNFTGTIQAGAGGLAVIPISFGKAAVGGQFYGYANGISGTILNGGVVDDPKLVFTKPLGTESGASSSGTDVPYWVLDPATDSIVLSGLMSWTSGVVPDEIESASLTASTEYFVIIDDGTNAAVIRLTAV